MTVTKLQHHKGGGHVHVLVFSGPDSDHLALNGSLAFLPAEWEAFAAALALGSVESKGEHDVLILDDDHVPPLNPPASVTP